MVTPTEDDYPDHDDGKFAPILATVATWRAPAFLENVAIDDEGAAFVTVYSHNRVDRYDPTTRATTTFAEVPAPPMGLAFDAGGVLWVTGGTLARGPDISGESNRAVPSANGVNFRTPASSTAARCIRMAERFWSARAPPAVSSRSIWTNLIAGVSGFREIG